MAGANLVRQAFPAGYVAWKIPENSHFLMGMVLAYTYSVLLVKVTVMKIPKSIPITWDVIPLELKPEIIKDNSFEFPDFLKIIEEAKASGFLKERPRITDNRTPLINMEAYNELYGNNGIQIEK